MRHNRLGFSTLRKVTIIVVVAFGTAGCASDYKSMDLFGGVEASPLTADSEIISARGNYFTDPSRVQQFVLLKSAQDCLAGGWDKFVMVSSQDTTRTNYSGWYSTLSQTSSMSAMVAPGSSVIVKFFRTDDPVGLNALDARQVTKSLQSVLSQ
jgi:hypothetical protein